MNAPGIARTFLARLLWLVAALAIALGGAGIVAAMHHVPGSGARAELTWAGDAAAAPVLDDVTVRLEQVSDEVDGLGSTARQALAAVVAGDAEQVNQTIASGTLQLATVLAAVATLESRLAEVPAVGDDNDLRLSPELQDRYTALSETPALTEDLEADWSRFTGLALDATNLNALLTRHDQETAAAAKQGAAGKYQSAIDLLDVSDATVAETMAVRDRLANTTDVSTLTTWLERNAAYDAALRTLYQRLEDANGELNDEIRAAFVAEQAAREALPVDTRPLIVIMADVAQGGLNQAVIRIEEARGALAEALDAQRRVQEGVELPE